MQIRITARLSIALATVAATSIAVVGGVTQIATAAPPTLTIPGRVYPGVGQAMNFSGQDPVSQDSRAITIGGLVNGSVGDGCNPDSSNDYEVEDCPNVQISLNSAKAGLLRIPGNTVVTDLDANPDVDKILAASGAVITQATDSHGLDSMVFHVTGLAADIQDTLDTLQFVPCQQQQGTSDPGAQPGDSPYEVDCGTLTGGAPTDEPLYEEAEEADGLLPNIHFTVIQGDGSGNVSGNIYLKIEGTNGAPTLAAPPAPFAAPAGGTLDVDDQVSVVDPEMCNFTICGNPYTNPGLVESDDEMLLVMWLAEQDCGTFDVLGTGFFTSVGGAGLPSVLDVVRDWTDLDLNDAEQDVAADAIAAAVQLTLSPGAWALDLSTQGSGPYTVFAGTAGLDDVRYTLENIDYHAPSDDATCHLNVAVSDLGNNGTPTTYVGSPFGPETPFTGHKSVDTNSDTIPDACPCDDVPFEVPNAQADVTSVTFNVSDQQPDVTISQIVPSQGGDPAGPNKPSGFRISFNTPIDPASFDASDLSLSTSSATGPALGALVPIIAGSEYTVPVEASGDGKLTLTFPGTVYAAGHNGDSGYANEPPVYDDNEITWDATGPTATLTLNPAQPDPILGPEVHFTVEFGDTVTSGPFDFQADDVTLGGTAGGTLIADVTQPDPLDLKTYDIKVTGMAASGTVTALVEANAVVDTALNPSQASAVVPANWDDGVDSVAPTVTINQALGQADTEIGNGPVTVEFTVTFSELVTGFTAGDVVGEPAGATVQVTGAGPTYTVAITVNATATVEPTIQVGAASDPSGNPSAASTSTDNSVSVTIDTAAPTVTVNEAAAQADPTSGPEVVFDIVFSEPVTGFTAGEVTVGGTAGATAATLSGSGDTYTATVSTAGLVTGTITASVGAGVAVDAATNGNMASTSTDNQVDYVAPLDPAPTVTVNEAAAQADPTSGPEVVFDIVFSEPVTGFTAGEVTVGGTAGATAATLSGSGDTYTATVSTAGLVTGTITASVGAGVALDAGNNVNTASTSTDNQVTFEVATGNASTPGGNVDVQVSGGGLLTFASSNPAVPPPAGWEFPYGQLSFSAATTPGGTVVFELTFPAPVTEYFKLNGGVWEAFTWDGTTGAQFNGNIVTITIIDGGRGDSDGSMDGVATDPGAPAVQAIVDPGSTTTTTVPDGGGGTTTTTTTPPGGGGATTTTVPGGGGGGATTTTLVTGPNGPTTLPAGPTVPPTGGLPATGGAPRAIALVATLLVGLGVVLVTARRRAQA